jgi:uncharacterized membrane protein
MQNQKYAFRMRGTMPSRLDAFSDVVFGFALTLLVVSLEVPKTFDELMVAMRGFVPFAICFALLLLIWYSHYVFFRRYGLHDPLTIALNSVLLFVTLFYVYPVKFLFSLLTGQFHVGIAGQIIRTVDIPTLMVIYGLGYAAVYLLFALLYVHAYRLRDQLELMPTEMLDTRVMVYESFALMTVGLLSALVASFSKPQYAGLSGFIYMLIGPMVSVFRTTHRKQRRKLEAQLDRESNMLEEERSSAMRA